jgi:GDP-D-mannose dehydratase
MIVERNLPLVSIITPSLNLLQGDATKAKTILGWKPEVAFQDLIEMMVKGGSGANRKDAGEGKRD